MAERITAIEALTQFESSLSKGGSTAPVVSEFIAFVGRDRAMDELGFGEVSRYVRERTDGTTAALEPLRAFLVYAAEQSLTTQDLLPALLPNPNAPGAHARNAAVSFDPNANAYHVTPEGLARLEQQIAEEKARRPEIAQKLHDAMQDKDFRENAPLDAARDEQAHLEARIRDLEQRRRNAVIVDEQSKGGRANVGSVVKLLNVKANKEQQFTLVSPTEVDPANGKISIDSPVGVAVINHSTGDEVTVNAPSGPMVFRVLDVQG